MACHGRGRLTAGLPAVGLAKAGGEGGIRTLGTVTRTHDFQSCTLDHSVTSPEIWPAHAIGLPAAWTRGEIQRKAVSWVKGLIPGGTTRHTCVSERQTAPRSAGLQPAESAHARRLHHGTQAPAARELLSEPTAKPRMTLSMGAARLKPKCLIPLTWLCSARYASAQQSCGTARDKCAAWRPAFAPTQSMGRICFID